MQIHLMEEIDLISFCRTRIVHELRIVSGSIEQLGIVVDFAISRQRELTLSATKGCATGFGLPFVAKLDKTLHNAESVAIHVSLAALGRKDLQSFLVAEEDCCAKLKPMGGRPLDGDVWCFYPHGFGRRLLQTAKSFPAERTYRIRN